VREWGAERVAAAAGAELVRAARPGAAGPASVTIDSREAARGALFVGLPGTRVDGGAFAQGALGSGAWGALVAAEHVAGLGGEGALLAVADPTAALGRLARAWRRELDARVIAITGSTGKTSTKDILSALLSGTLRTVATRANFNTEIGLPLEILAAPAGTEVLVLELAMRGAGQIAELAQIAEPDVGVIVNIGPVHLELLGSLEAIAAAKAELLTGLRPGATAVVPAGQRLLEAHLRDDLETLTFGPGGDAELRAVDGSRLEIALGSNVVSVEVSFTGPHQHSNLLAALLAAQAVGVAPPARIDVVFSAGRGDRHESARGVLVIDDCYNANPMSMRAALDELATHEGRRVAVLGDMLELGPDERRFHDEIGTYARKRGVDVLVAVGPLAAEMAGSFRGEAHVVPDAAAAAELAPDLVAPGDAVLVKASRGVGLEAVVEALH
jgi:UDP-N-acetylmuramoyl-tripeptide--D-alanyl-D-alanine ligase